MDQAIRLKRAHLAMMKQPSTALYSGVFLMGKSEMVSGQFTAYTDGVNKRYCYDYMEKLTDPQFRGVVLHENLHVALKHLTIGKNFFEKNQMVANIAADFVVNDIIMNIKVKLQGKEERLVDLPSGAMYDEMFHNWSFPKVFAYLMKELDEDENNGSRDGEGGGSCDDGEEGSDGQSSGPSKGGGKRKVKVNGKEYDLSKADEHDFTNAKDMTPEKIKEMGDKIDKALREGGILAGRLGAEIPRAITDMLTPKIDWRQALAEFLMSFARGADEYTWRKPNKRHLANDYILPGVEVESMGELIVAFDTSGSIGDDILNMFASELASLCEVCVPERVRVLWWDTKVHGEQIFEGKYDNLKEVLKPKGGGGTRVSCVSEYVVNNMIKADCLLVFTDGYLEPSINWTTGIPSLWLVTENNFFAPPGAGKMVNVSN
jgi:hypothetical protein